MKKSTKNSFAVISTFFLINGFPPAIADTGTTELGRQLFFDNNLSLNRSQSCATCHNPAAGFVDNRDNGTDAAVSLGDDGSSLGGRTAPTATYASFAPTFHYDIKAEQYVGGQFWDGRAKDLQEQAGGPPLNPLEMQMPDKESVKKRIQENTTYIQSFKQHYGNNIFDNNDKFYSAMTDAIATFEKSRFFSPFDSKYDRYLKGEYELSDQEELGMSLFFSNNNTNCSTCHALHGEDHPRETFTNYQFHNLGVPANTLLQKTNITDSNAVDHGLLSNPSVDGAEHDGKFKVPTLRNVAITAPYMHNSVFKDLKTVMEFYDKYNNPKRTNNPETGKPWLDPEVEETINRKDLKARKLSDQKIDALISFLKILTDKRYEQFLETKK
ncbi:MAG: c-type cytochrome [Gammaproteobacteria bacterium]|nr:c-type cytochrome [Gammaproteobacteria bacterium]